jgi:hypothetical protein
MHTAIEQKLQNLNSYVFENFQPEEIDLFINEAQETFIKQRLYPDSNPKRRGFEDTSKRLADLQSIVKEVSLLPVIDNTNPDYRRYLLGSATPILVTAAAAGSLYQIVSVGNTTFTTIGAPNNEVGTVFIASAAGTGTGTVTLYDYFIHVSSRINLVVNAKPLAIEQGITTRYLGMAVTTTNPATPTPVRGDFYIANTTGSYTNFALSPTRNNILYYDGSAWSIRALPVFNFPVYNSPVRVSEHEDVFRDQTNPFAKSTERSPLAVVRENSLRVLHSERLILKDLFMTYIRKPRAVSITSLLNCELPEHTHLEIVDSVVNRILEVIESQRYQSSNQESLKNE